MVWTALLGSRVGGVVGADNEARVHAVHVRVHLLHLLDPIVGHPCLCQQDVHLAGHTACDRGCRSAPRCPCPGGSSQWTPRRSGTAPPPCRSQGRSSRTWTLP